MLGPLALTFDPTVNVGSLIIAATTLVAVVGAWYALRGSVDKISGRVDAITDLLLRHEQGMGKRLDRTDEKMDRLEGVVSTQAQVMQRLIGGMEIRDRLDFNPSNERRSRERER